MDQEIQELEAQMGLAVAALGAIFAKTLAEDDVPPMVLKTLRKKAAEMHQHLKLRTRNPPRECLRRLFGR